MSRADTALANAVYDAIARVEDPCSVAANAPLTVFELGLVRAWSVDPNGDVTVSISPTAPSCVLIAGMKTSIEQHVAGVEGVRNVQVDIETSTLWSTRMMTDDGRRKLEQRRALSLDSVPVRPRQWEAESASRAQDRASRRGPYRRG